MHFFTLFTALAPITASLGIPTREVNGKDLIVNTTSGRYRPFLPKSHPNIASFPDISYAKNPTGQLRFAPPVAATPPTSDNVGYSEELPLGCFQYVPSYLSDSVAFENGAAGSFQRGDYANTTEDCLKLSIFAPTYAVEHAFSSSVGREAGRKHHRPLPVVIWIHGGGFVFGGTNVPYQLSPNWVQRSQGHIVVQVQYRLGLLGLPNAAGLAKAGRNVNLSLLDQRLAVEWVRDNIASMGGDPKRITLWGESAGAYATDGYLFSWAKDPIVAGVIADSGNAIALEKQMRTAPVADYSQFSAVAERLGCGGLDPDEELSCMRSVSEDDIKDYVQAPAGAGGALDDNLQIGTIVDNVTIFADYTARIAHGNDQFASHIPLLIGTNTDEGTAVVPYHFNGSEVALTLPPSLLPVAENFTLNAHCTTLREVRLRAEAGSLSWQYLYAGNFTDVSPRAWLGSYHTAELPMVFGTFEPEGEEAAFERKVSREMQDLYLEFAKSPSHGLSRRGWKPAHGDSHRQEVREWAANGIVGKMVDMAVIKNSCIKNGYEV